MDYLVECRCTHDLTFHDQSGCRGEAKRCPCKRTKLEALDAAIELARTSPWNRYLRKEDGDAEEAASA